MEQSKPDNLKYLDQLTERLFALDEELIRVIGNEDWAHYEESRRALQRMKEEYKRLTGIYPRLRSS